MAKQKQGLAPDPEDLFADTRMSFGDHIEDLRSHLHRAIYGFIAALVISLFPPIGPAAFKFVIKPVEDQLIDFYDRYYAERFAKLVKDKQSEVPPIQMTMRLHGPSLRAVIKGEDLGKPQLENMVPALNKVVQALQLYQAPSQDAKEDWYNLPVEIPDPVAIAKAMTEVNRQVRPERMTAMRVEEVFMVYLMVCLLVGFVIASPWVFYQVWSFIAAGLYPHEKRLVNVYLPVSIGLFLAGFFVCEFLALPKAIEALLWFNEWLGIAPELRLSEWLGFALIMPLIFGLSFQTPLVMLFFFKIGIFGVETYTSKRRISYFLMAVFAAVITPSTDAPTMMLLWVPMCLLFEVGVILCKMQPQPLPDELDESDLDAMVGV
jgi:sec-independent protein translocase protein TatC